MRKELGGFLETDDGLERFHLIYDKENFSSLWVNDNLYDDLDSIEEIREYCNNKYFESKEDYKKDNCKNLSDWINEIST